MLCVQSPNLYQHSLAKGLSSMGLKDEQCKPAKIYKIDSYQMLKKSSLFRELSSDEKMGCIQMQHFLGKQSTLPSLKRYVTKYLKNIRIQD